MNTNRTRHAESLYSNAIVSILGTLKTETMLFYVFVPMTMPEREVYLLKHTCTWDSDLSCMEVPKLIAQKASLWPINNTDELTTEELDTIYSRQEYTRIHA